MNNTHLVIMAGGVGSRFWPMSTPECPKQFLDLTGCGNTMIRETMERFGELVSPDHVWVVTSKNYAGLVQEQFPEVPVSNILLEPCMRNTTACIAYVAWKIKSRFQDANIIITPSDHLVKYEVEFRRVVANALEFVSKGNNIVTLGMMPTRPETGYGYIQASEEKAADEIFKVNAFKEKPVKEVAETYLQEGNYFWNSGIFIWNINTIETAIRSFVPDIAEIFDTLTPFYYTDMEQVQIDQLFPSCRSVSIDYSVMEKSENVYVYPAEFGWSDLGTWGSLHTLISTDDNKNGVIGDKVSMIESKNCMVHLPEGKKVVLQGLEIGRASCRARVLSLV